jgi:uncharacterized protein YkwD
MATNNCFAHNSCDGTDWATRIEGAYTCSGYIGENIAAGFPDPRVSVNQWLCDESGGTCCPDFDNSCVYGHRQSIQDIGMKVCL